MNKTTLAAMVCVLSVVDGCAEDCTPPPTGVGISVIDSLGNVVPIEAASISTGESDHDAGAGVDCEIDRLRGVAACPVSRAGRATVRVVTQGQTLSQAFETTQRKVEEDTCALSVPQITMRYDGPRCDLTSLVVAEGNVTRSDGMPVVDRVTISRRGELNAQRDCAVDGGHFACRALDSVTTEYDVAIDTGFSHVTRTVAANFSGCRAAASTELDVDLTQPCTGVRAPAATVYAHLLESPSQTALNVIADRVTIAIGAGGPPTECALADAPTTPGPRGFDCPALTRNGGGPYRFEVFFRGESRTADVRVGDDGCSPGTRVVEVTF